jgi:hypothetical protein
MSSQDMLSTTLDPAAGDLDLGPLLSSSGAQGYPLGEGAGARRQVFVFSALLGVEAGQATLADPGAGQ